MRFPILTVIIFLPLVGAIVTAAVPDRQARARWLASFFTGATFILTVMLYYAFDKGGAGMQFVQKLDWVPGLGMSYHLGVDGISLPMVVLTGLLSLLAVVASWKIDVRPKHYFALLMLLEVGMLGVFLALDFVLFYIFWEVVLVPMYFLIGIWGGPRREYAAIKFFLYTLLGSVIMLVGILALYFAPGVRTFDMLAAARHNFPVALQGWVFLAFFAGFAVKVPLFPFHTWLPDAHVEAPTAVSVILAGVLLKMGSYGFIRIVLPILPDAFRVYAPYLAALSLIGIVYGAMVAMVQKDLKRLVAYSSVSHMGYVMLGIAAGTTAAVNGAVIQMFNHGTITGMLFLLVGLVYERTHTRQIADLGGLSSKVPVLGGILAFASFASLGLPGLSGFIGEFMILLGTYQSLLSKTAVYVAAGAIVLTAGYLLWMLQRVSLGTLPEKLEGLVDIDLREASTLVPLMAIIVVVGVYPTVMLSIINPSVQQLLSMAGGP
ncbi:MAG: NADH-quinone oxidoreductase subunit M [Actinobacteria bacterium]|nr:MAG: NADH-quinone oxidoreductase subunit M [Actinomycetota bacterium]